MAENEDDFDSLEPFEDDPDDATSRRRRGRSERRGEEPESADTGEVYAPRADRGEDDFGFDEPFAEEEEQAGPSRRRRRIGRRGRSRRGGRGAGGGAAVLQRPAARLGLVGALLAILIVVIVLVVRDCQRDALVDSYTRYMTSVGELVNQSAEQGRQLRTTLANRPGDNPPTLRRKVTAIRNQAQGLVDRAGELDPPGSLEGAQGSLVTALEYRVNGLGQLAEALPELISSNDNDFAASGIAAQMQRFLASDVIYADSFVGPAKRALNDDDISGVEVAENLPFLPNAAWASTAGARTLLPGLRRSGRQSGGGGDTGGNLHGTSLVRVEVLPAGDPLTPGTPVTIQASEELRWRVTIENGGDFIENGIVVRARFSYPDSPGEAEAKEAQIETIAPGEEASVEIPGPTTPNFGEQGNLAIEVVPVPDEARVENNRAEYQVTITI